MTRSSGACLPALRPRITHGGSGQGAVRHTGHLQPCSSWSGDQERACARSTGETVQITHSKGSLQPVLPFRPKKSTHIPQRVLDNPSLRLLSHQGASIPTSSRLLQAPPAASSNNCALPRLPSHPDPPADLGCISIKGVARDFPDSSLWQHIH